MTIKLFHENHLNYAGQKMQESEGPANGLQTISSNRSVSCNIMTHMQEKQKIWAAE